MTDTNCPNCGAPVDPRARRCPYCETPYPNADLETYEAYFADNTSVEIVVRRLSEAVKMVEADANEVTEWAKNHPETAEQAAATVMNIGRAIESRFADLRETFEYILSSFVDDIKNIFS